MQDMGIADAHVDQDGYVYGTVPANCDKKIPVYGLIAHMDTSPDAPGENIRARITVALRRRRYCPERREAHHAFSEGIPAAEKLCRQAPDRHGRHDAARRGR